MVDRRRSKRVSERAAPEGSRRFRAPVLLLSLALSLVAASCGPLAQDDDGTVSQTVDTLQVDLDGSGVDASAADESAADGASGSLEATDPADVDAIEAILAAMTPEEKIGQLLMPQVFGTDDQSLTEAQRRSNVEAHGYPTPSEIVAGHSLGGVIYLENNVVSAPQLRAFSASLQDSAMASTGIGLLIAVDQEGGRVSRISDEVSSFPPAADLGSDPALAREVGYVTGQQIQQQGVNVVLAPVADVVNPGNPGFIGDRSFGDDPASVATMVAASVEGLQTSGVAAAVKHWPGHGATAIDSHATLPTVDLDRSSWDERDRIPFDAAIKQGVAIVLVGHLAFPQLDPSGRPATVSPVLINELLRDELGFGGVVMSDALNMGAVADIPADELAVASLQAGIDVILMPPSVSRTSSALIAALGDGSITTEQLDAAVVRVLRLKQQLGLLETEEPTS